jgi:DNA-binding transcriptional LysR family regulator
MYPTLTFTICGAKPTDLSKHTCIVMAFQTPGRWAFRTHSGTDEVEIAPRVRTDNSEAALRLALEGAGIVRLGDLIVAEPIRRGLLTPLLTDVHHAAPVPLSALYLAGRHRLPKVRVFLDFLVERFSSAPWHVVPQNSMVPGRNERAR